MEELIDFFLNTNSNIFAYQTVEITHSAFTQDYYLVRNNSNGITATDENSISKFFQYCPLRLVLGGQKTTTENFIELELGDLGEIISAEIENIKALGDFTEYPQFTYRSFRSDDLTQPLEGPITLLLSDVALSEEGAKIKARSINLNTNRTGENYTLERFPMLRALL